MAQEDEAKGRGDNPGTSEQRKENRKTELRDSQLRADSYGTLLLSAERGDQECEAKILGPFGETRFPAEITDTSFSESSAYSMGQLEEDWEDAPAPKGNR